MENFFENLGEHIAETAETLTDRVGDLVEVTRLRNQIRSLKQENRNDLRQLGEYVYEQYRNKEKVSKKFEVLCEAIKERSKSMENLQGKISALKGESLCPCCGKYSPKGTSYCPYCGAKLCGDEKAQPQDFREKAEDMAVKMKEKAEDFAEKVKEKAQEAIKNAEEKAHSHEKDDECGCGGGDDAPKEKD